MCGRVALERASAGRPRRRSPATGCVAAAEKRSPSVSDRQLGDIQQLSNGWVRTRPVSSSPRLWPQPFPSIQSKNREDATPSCDASLRPTRWSQNAGRATGRRQLLGRGITARARQIARQRGGHPPALRWALENVRCSGWIPSNPLIAPNRKCPIRARRSASTLSCCRACGLDASGRAVVEQVGAGVSAVRGRGGTGVGWSLESSGQSR